MLARILGSAGKNDASPARSARYWQIAFELPQHQVAVAQDRHLAHRIDGQIIRVAMLTLVQPDQGMLDVREVQMRDDGGHLAGIG